MLSSKQASSFVIVSFHLLDFFYSEFDYEIDADGYIKFLWKIMKSNKFIAIRNGFSEPFA